MIVFAVIALLVSAALLFASTRKTKRADRLLSSETTTVGELVNLAREIASELGGGVFEKQVSLSGRLLTEDPLKSPLTGKDCAWYHLRVTHEYEEPESTQAPPARGRMVKGGASKRRNTTVQRRGPTRSETVTDNKLSAPLALHAEDASLRLDLDNAEIELAPTYEIFLPGYPAHGVLVHGAFTMQVGTNYGHRQTRGFRLTERILPLNEEVHIHAMVSDTEGALKLHRGEDTPLVVTSESRDSLIRRHQRSARNLKIAGLVSAGISAVLFVLHFVS